MFDDEDELEAFLAKKQRTTLLLHRDGAPRPGDASLSYLGGLPRLPPGVAWPEVERRLEDGPGEGPIAPTFIGQIDLATLPVWRGRKMFPTTGTIYIFCNTQFTDVGDPFCKVLYSPKSSLDFPECLPPSNLMRLGGVYDGIKRPWIKSDREAGIEYKYALSFEPDESPDDDTPSGDEVTEPDLGWARSMMFGTPRLLRHSWPHTPLFVQTFKEHLVAQTLRAKVGYDGKPWDGFPALLELVQTLPDLSGDPYRWLDQHERDGVRKIIPEFLAQFRERTKGASYIGRFYLVDESLLYCVAKGFAEGKFTKETDEGRLFAGLEEASRDMFWPHQMLGVGSRLQDAALEHAEDTLLLQISDSDCLDFTGGSGVLQIWVPGEDLKKGEFENVTATYDC